jgi:hypothetical protein
MTTIDQYGSTPTNIRGPAPAAKARVQGAAAGERSGEANRLAARGAALPSEISAIFSEGLF